MWLSLQPEMKCWAWLCQGCACQVSGAAGALLCVSGVLEASAPTAQMQLAFKNSRNAPETLQVAFCQSQGPKVWMRATCTQQRLSHQGSLEQTAGLYCGPFETTEISPLVKAALQCLTNNSKIQDFCSLCKTQRYVRETEMTKNHKVIPRMWIEIISQFPFFQPWGFALIYS